MLTELRIANFAIIEQLTLEFERGLQILTGETGAGKSIIVDAIALLVGGRADESFIRSEADEAVLEAAFALPVASSLAKRLREEGLLGAGESDLIIRRVLSRAGRHKLYLNGNLTPLRTLQSLAGTLIDIHGQHEQQSLLSSERQLEALDAFAHLEETRAAYRHAYDQWRAWEEAYTRTAVQVSEQAQREELLRYQLEELQEANVQPGEEAALLAERSRLAHAQRLSDLSQQCYALLYGAEDSVLGMLSQVRETLTELAALDRQGVEWATVCDGTVAQLRELAYHLKRFSDRVEQDPERLAWIDARLDLIQRLKKKYGGSEEALLARREQLERELDERDSGLARLREIERRMVEARQEVAALGERLSRERLKAARKLEMKVHEELAALRMERTQFVVVVEPDLSEGSFGPWGRDRIEYRLSANEGEPVQPLARIASGGELSRIMLALKTVLAQADGVPIVIFDEIDSGVGGGVAAMMGRRLRDLAKHHQVFCITHLPQIAAYADVHYLVEKSVFRKRTVVRARKLSWTERQEELARMLGGLSVTNAARKTAAEMMNEAQQVL